MGTLSEKVELFKTRLISETIRQWVLLLVILWMIVVIISSCVTLIRNYRKIHSVDWIVLILIVIKLLLILSFEFLYPHRFLLFLADLVFMVILSIIFTMFSKNMNASNLCWKLRESSTLYKLMSSKVLSIIVMTILIVGLLTAGILKYNQSFTWIEEENLDNYLVYVTQGFMALITICILALTITILRQYKFRESQYSKHSDNSNASSQNYSEQDLLINDDVINLKKEYSIKKWQLKVLTIGLVINSTLFWIFTVIAYTLLFPKNKFEWINSLFLRPLGHDSVWVVFILNMLSLCPSFLFWYVVFYVPFKNKRLDVKIFRTTLRIEAGESSVSMEKFIDSSEPNEHIMLNPTFRASSCSKSSQDGNADKSYDNYDTNEFTIKVSKYPF